VTILWHRPLACEEKREDVQAIIRSTGETPVPHGVLKQFLEKMES
jgi:hypothetical protein